MKLIDFLTKLSKNFQIIIMIKDNEIKNSNSGDIINKIVRNQNIS